MEEDKILTDDELTRLKKQVEIEEIKKRLQDADPWYVRAVRPSITVVVVMTLSTVLIHGCLWAGDRNAFEATTQIGGMILAFWFGGRGAKK